MADFERALSEIKPAFGAVTETLEQYRLNGIIDSGEKFRHLQSTCRNLVEQVSSTYTLAVMLPVVLYFAEACVYVLNLSIGFQTYFSC